MGMSGRRNILSGPGRPLADRFPEGWRRALGASWAGSFEAGTPANLDEISELEGRGDRCSLPIRPGQNDARDKAETLTALCRGGHAGDRGPGLKGLGPGGSVLGGRAVIAAEGEEIVDPVMGEEEALGLADQCEPLDRPFSYDLRLISSR